MGRRGGGAWERRDRKGSIDKGNGWVCRDDCRGRASDTIFVCLDSLAEKFQVF